MIDVNSDFIVFTQKKRVSKRNFLYKLLNAIKKIIRRVLLWTQS